MGQKTKKKKKNQQPNNKQRKCLKVYGLLGYKTWKQNKTRYPEFAQRPQWSVPSVKDVKVGGGKHLLSLSRNQAEQ